MDNQQQQLPPLSDEEELTEEVIETYLKALGHLKSRIYILPPTGHLGIMSSFIQDPTHTVVGLDWDQTITKIENKELGPKATKTVRGDKETRDALTTWWNAGASLIVITAQPPSAAVVNNLRTEVIKLGLQELFHVPEVDKDKIFNHIHQWGPNADLDVDQLTRRLVVLFVLHSTRFAADLARIGDPSRIQIQPDNLKAQYQLLNHDPTSPSFGEFGGRQPLVPRKVTVDGKSTVVSDDHTCPVKALREYIEKTKGMRVVTVEGDVEKHQVQRLFLKKSETGEYVAMEAADLIDIFRKVLEEIGIPIDQLNMVVEDPVKLIQGEGGLVCRMSNLFCSGYNKPEAMVQFLKTKPDIKHILFVDDNSDNAWNLFFHFAKEEISGSDKHISSFWFPPPPGGKDEKHCAAVRKVLKRLYDQYGDPPSHVLLGD